MIPREKLGALVPGERKPVDVEAIEAELARLWRDAAHGEEAVTRACLWNVIVHTLDDRVADEAGEDLAELTVAIPSRAILIRTDPGSSSDRIESWITTNCRREDGGRRHVCCEEIIISAHGRTMSELPPLLSALLAPDVPSALFWMEEPSLAGRHMHEWLGAVDRFIFDSGRQSVARELQFLRDALAHTSRPPALGDLNWHRIRAWRALTARLFDFAGPRAAIAGARSVAAWGEPCMLASSASLFLGWLGSRLGRSAERGALVSPEGRRTALQLHESEGSPALGGLSRIRFEGEAGAIELAREADCLLAKCDGRVKAPGGLGTLVRPRDRTSLLAAELEEYGGDPVLAQAMPLAAALLEPEGA